MQKVLLTHNPYKVISTIEINGEKPKRDSTLIQYLDKRFQLWVDKLPELLEDVCLSLIHISGEGPVSGHRAEPCGRQNL